MEVPIILVVCGDETLEFLEPVLDDDDFLAFLSCHPAFSNHQESLAVGVNVVLVLFQDMFGFDDAAGFGLRS